MKARVIIPRPDSPFGSEVELKDPQQLLKAGDKIWSKDEQGFWKHVDTVGGWDGNKLGMIKGMYPTFKFTRSPA